MSTYTHVPHPHTLERLWSIATIQKVADVYKERASTKYNAWLAVKITNGRDDVVCLRLRRTCAHWPACRLVPGGEGIISWIAQTFLQLVLLSIIIVGQNIAASIWTS